MFGTVQWPSNSVHRVVSYLYGPAAFQLSVSVQSYLKEGRSKPEFQVASKVPNSTVSPHLLVAKDKIVDVLA